MTRQLDTVTLDKAARHYAAEWMRPDLRSLTVNGKAFIGGQSYVLQDFYNFTFKDEFEYMLARIKKWLGPAAMDEFEEKTQQRFEPRDAKIFHDLLAERLAIDPQGKHIPGMVGKVQLGNRVVAKQHKIVRLTRGKEISLIKNVYWPIYAGEEEERAAGSKSVDQLPRADLPPAPAGGATVPNISAALAIKIADIIDVEFNIGDAAANIAGRSGAQPNDPDAAESGTLLFTLVMSDPAFGAAGDDTPGGIITASSITDDSSADATATLGYCRCKAMGAGADDVLDGEAGTSGADFNFNTLAIVSGATVSMTSFTVTMPQGSTAA